MTSNQQQQQESRNNSNTTPLQQQHHQNPFLVPPVVNPAVVSSISSPTQHQTNGATMLIGASAGMTVQQQPTTTTPRSGRGSGINATTTTTTTTGSSNNNNSGSGRGLPRYLPPMENSNNNVANPGNNNNNNDINQNQQANVTPTGNSSLEPLANHWPQNNNANPNHSDNNNNNNATDSGGPNNNSQRQVDNTTSGYINRQVSQEALNIHNSNNNSSSTAGTFGVVRVTATAAPLPDEQGESANPSPLNPGEETGDDDDDGTNPNNSRSNSRQRRTTGVYYGGGGGSAALNPSYSNGHQRSTTNGSSNNRDDTETPARENEDDDRDGNDSDSNQNTSRNAEPIVHNSMNQTTNNNNGAYSSLNNTLQSSLNASPNTNEAAAGNNNNNNQQQQQGSSSNRQQQQQQQQFQLSPTMPSGYPHQHHHHHHNVFASFPSSYIDNNGQQRFVSLHPSNGHPYQHHHHLQLPHSSYPHQLPSLNQSSSHEIGIDDATTVAAGATTNLPGGGMRIIGLGENGGPPFVYPYQVGNGNNNGSTTPPTLEQYYLAQQQQNQNGNTTNSSSARATTAPSGHLYTAQFHRQGLSENHGNNNNNNGNNNNNTTNSGPSTPTPMSLHNLQHLQYLPRPQSSGGVLNHQTNNRLLHPQATSPTASGRNNNNNTVGNILLQQPLSHPRNNNSSNNNGLTAQEQEFLGPPPYSNAPFAVSCAEQDARRNAPVTLSDALWRLATLIDSDPSIRDTIVDKDLKTKDVSRETIVSLFDRTLSAFHSSVPEYIKNKNIIFNENFRRPPCVVLNLSILEWGNICNFLDVTDLEALSMTCTKLHRTISENEYIWSQLCATTLPRYHEWSKLQDKPEPMLENASWRQIVKDRSLLDKKWFSRTAADMEVRGFPVNRGAHSVILDEDTIYYTTSQQYEMQCLNLRTGARPYGNGVPTGHNHSITSMKIVQEFPEYIITASVDSTLRLFNRNTKASVGEFKGHTDRVWGVDSYKDIVFSGGTDKTVRMWSLENRTAVGIIEEQHTSVSSVRVMRTGGNAYVACGSSGSSIRVWDIGNGSLKTAARFRGHQKGVYCLQDSGRLLFSGSLDNVIVGWDPRAKFAKAMTLMQYDAHGNAIINAATTGPPLDNVGIVTFTVDDTKLVAGCADNMIKIWDLRMRKIVNELKEHTHWVTSIQMDSKKLVSTSRDRTIRIWDMDGSLNSYLHSSIGKPPATGHNSNATAAPAPASNNNATNTAAPSTTNTNNNNNNTAPSGSASPQQQQNASP